MLPTCRVIPCLLLLATLLSGPAAGQAPQPNEPATVQQQPPERVMDVAEAQRAKEREHGIQAWDWPLLPFRKLGYWTERGLVAAEQSYLLDKLRYWTTERERGFLPLFGGLGTGTGLAVGVKYYDNNFLVPGGELDIPVRVSSQLYQQYGLAMALPLTSSRRIYFDTGTNYRVRTQDDFFGLGNDSLVSNRTDYMLKIREFYAGPRLQFSRRTALAARAGYRGTTVFNGRNARYPGIGERFSPPEVPGLAEGARLWTIGAGFTHDRRDLPGRPHKGGYYEANAHWMGSADAKDFGFWRYEVEAEQYVPMGQFRTLALRFIGITNQPRGGSQVPFFEQAIFGGSHTMRGYRQFRFHDLSGALVTAEYRYNLNSFMDFVVFVDEGQVARQPGDFSWSGFRTGYGAGVRFLSAQGTPFRIILGRSREGNRLYFSLGSYF